MEKYIAARIKPTDYTRFKRVAIEGPKIYDKDAAMERLDALPKLYKEVLLSNKKNTNKIVHPLRRRFFEGKLCQQKKAATIIDEVYDSLTKAAKVKRNRDRHKK